MAQVGKNICRMKIVKAIKISQHNVQEIWNCPVVERIERIRMEKMSNIENDTMLVFVQGHRDYTREGWFLVKNEKGEWDTMPLHILEEHDVKEFID